MGGYKVILITIIHILLVALVLCSTLFARNHIVHRCRLRALGETSAKAKAAIKAGDEDWERFYDEYRDCPSYDAMLYDPLKWTYRQFYPDM